MSAIDQLNAALTGRYVIERELGAGGMATVYLAHDLKHDRHVAIKVLRADLGASLGAERFLREIRIAAQLHHPHILGLLDSGEANGLLYYVMPFVDGESLRERIAREGALPIPDAVRIMHEIADALAAAHARGVVHRDVKPDNILLEGRHALVMDFGVAKAVRDAAGPVGMTGTGVSIGTPAYMAPEQIAGEANADQRVDVYALGLVAYEMLTGRPPFTAVNAQQLLASHMTEKPIAASTLRPAVPPALNALVMKCLEKQPADRWQSAAELLPELNTLATTSGSGSAIVSAPRKRWTLPVVAAATVLLLAAGGWWIAHRARAAPSAESDIRSIAVLPFEERDSQAAPGGAFLGDGMAETLIYALGKVPGFKVAAQTSAFSFKGKEADLATIGAKLGVATVLTGSLQRADSRLRVTVRLESVANRAQLWSAQYDEELKDVFALQDKIAHAVVDHLQSSASRPGATTIVNAGTKNVEAYQAYLEGRYFWGQRGDGIKKGLRLFERAVALDPDYALAWTGVADTYSLLSTYGDLPVDVAIPKARQAVARALALDSTLAAAHATLGYILQTNAYDWDGADREFRRAIALDSTYVIARYWYGNFLSLSRGRFAEGLVENRVAVALDPLSPQAANLLAMALFEDGKVDAAIAEARRAISLVPMWNNYRVLGAALAIAGRLREAITALDSASAMSPQNPWIATLLVKVLARSGDSTRARFVFDEMNSNVRSGRRNSMFMASAASWVAGPDATFRWLERERSDHASSLAWPYMVNLFAPATVRDSRFAAFWAQMKVIPAPGL
ncbi:MAG: protein kinase [Gemmatimonadales bacterium]